MRRSFTQQTLTSLRNIPLDRALASLAIHCKADPTYLPLKNPCSRRWHVCTTRGEFEILTTGLKWYDTRARKGGGGAIDLAMHLLAVPFLQAANRLLEQQPLAATRL